MASKSNQSGELAAGRDVLVGALVGHFSGRGPREELPKGVLRELGQELAASGLVRDELVAFWNLLEEGLGRVGYRRPSGGEVTVLNLACGPCIEGAIFGAYFGEPGGVDGGRNKVRMFGMDLRGQEIEKAKRRYAATEEIFRGAGLPLLRETGDAAAAEVEFFADDATRLVGYKETPAAFDVVFIRHQNVWNDRLAWRKIYAFALGAVEEEGGLMVITSYFDREHLIALELVKMLGGEVLVSVRNPRTVELDAPGKSADRHLAVVRRKG